MPQAAPACNTCLDLRYWEKSHLSIEALERVSDHDHSTKNLKVDFELDTIQLSAARCELCTILLEGLVHFLGPQWMESCYYIELAVGLPSTIRLDIYDTSFKRKAIEFYTTQYFHQACSKRERPVLPKRVVRLASYNVSPVLYETSDDERADYVALSYCWGGGKHLLTTQNTIRSHKADALHLALGLGVEFIWIDALCIILDDPVGWKEEASKFGSVYRDALITVSATASPNTTSGIFCGQRSQRHKLRTHVASMKNIDIYMRQTCSTTQVGLFEHLNIFGNGYQEEEVLPILGRGWTFQERILSRRLLHCSSEELTWECGSGDMYCECASMVPYTRQKVSRKKVVSEMVSLEPGTEPTAPYVNGKS
ncbi:heterokaryon incompatibility protein-domain-containing protein [Aspergillus sergii]|uniref:Heterokaryon incompatibility protein-domain-containing protein n=1 Tax=Aspergillus sergii TaxID=1034303 RepID=A0A5N6XLK7_9EURO|nr:heterokaryon incompatibility protein-domain-containing protein [Aspergillus sergii]